MKVSVSHEFEVEVEVEHLGSQVLVFAVEVDSDGGIYHYPKDLDEPELIAEFTASECAGLSDAEIIAKAGVTG